MERDNNVKRFVEQRPTRSSWYSVSKNGEQDSWIWRYWDNKKESWFYFDFNTPVKDEDGDGYKFWYMYNVDLMPVKISQEDYSFLVESINGIKEYLDIGRIDKVFSLLNKFIFDMEAEGEIKLCVIAEDIDRRLWENN